ncbi:MAG: cell division topological specificity factor MinE [Chloroflexota bacterium]|nr:cell division topological specificity factor MinE [Chloroflexota bacterium]MDE2948105.1 cell division topological specificity factor MinE [Chloroflexota bacterium]
MTNLLSRLFGRGKKGSGATAKDRLRFVLQHDRINLPPERMEEMKREILAVIVKYLVVDKDRVEIDLEQRDRSHSKLVAEIPVVINTPPSAANSVNQSVSAADGSDANGANKGVDTDGNDDAQDGDAEDDDAGKETEDAQTEQRENGEETKDAKA